MNCEEEEKDKSNESNCEEFHTLFNVTENYQKEMQCFVIEMLCIK